MGRQEQVTASQRARYVEILEGLFDATFELKRLQQDASVEKARAETFALAGEVLGIFERSKLQQLMNESHVRILGTQISQTENDQSVQYREALAQNKFELFDIPTLLRQQADTPDK
ncbi:MULTISPECIES: hypothetical protein [Corallincola]|uniref:Uncharacterized protein n=3 Tax=Corallincola TaxID=1775176 RepID=A0A368NMT3_9GAMM|nr:MULTISPECIES: hypothetical protein [Corallincola]RCU51718.1 hypothetical protein DU002_04400 [Corallincola holothuriorum]TAA47215.1 hypothetical protein EXY25_08215 [Corallincola spongiicola]TCI04876.1 hypothetical protein EZV61_02585 [Corallincola luteus]